MANGKMSAAQDYFRQAVLAHPGCMASVKAAYASCCYMAEKYDLARTAAMKAVETEVREDIVRRADSVHILCEVHILCVDRVSKIDVFTWCCDIVGWRREWWGLQGIESNRIGLYSCGLVVRTRVPRYMTSLISSTSLRSSIGRIILSWLLVIEIRRY